MSLLDSLVPPSQQIQNSLNQQQSITETIPILFPPFPDFYQADWAYAGQTMEQLITQRKEQEQKINEFLKINAANRELNEILQVQLRLQAQEMRQMYRDFDLALQQKDAKFQALHDQDIQQHRKLFRQRHLQNVRLRNFKNVSTSRYKFQTQNLEAQRLQFETELKKLQKELESAVQSLQNQISAQKADSDNNLEAAENKFQSQSTEFRDSVQKQFSEVSEQVKTAITEARQTETECGKLHKVVEINNQRAEQSLQVATDNFSESVALTEKRINLSIQQLNERLETEMEINTQTALDVQERLEGISVFQAEQEHFNVQIAELADMVENFQERFDQSLYENLQYPQEGGESPINTKLAEELSQSEEVDGQTNLMVESKTVTGIHQVADDCRIIETHANNNQASVSIQQIIANPASQSLTNKAAQSNTKVSKQSKFSQSAQTRDYKVDSNFVTNQDLLSKSSMSLEMVDRMRQGVQEFLKSVISD